MSLFTISTVLMVLVCASAAHGGPNEALATFAALNDAICLDPENFVLQPVPSLCADVLCDGLTDLCIFDDAKKEVFCATADAECLAAFHASLGLTTIATTPKAVVTTVATVATNAPVVTTMSNVPVTTKAPVPAVTTKPVVTVKPAVPAPAAAKPNSYCAFWASLGECTKNKVWMSSNCAAACSGTPLPAPVPSTVACADKDTKNCPAWAGKGYCTSNPFWMKPNCQKSCGTCGCTVDYAGMNTAPCAVKVAAAPKPVPGSVPVPAPLPAPAPSTATKPGAVPTDLPTFAATNDMNNDCLSETEYVITPRPATCNGFTCQGPSDICIYDINTGPDCYTASSECLAAFNAANAKPQVPDYNPDLPTFAAMNTALCLDDTKFILYPEPLKCGSGPCSATELCIYDDADGSVACDTTAGPCLTAWNALVPGVPAPAPGAVTPQPVPAPTGSCTDKDTINCAAWASKGECDKNPYWMKPNCQKSCGTCGCTVVNAGTSTAPCKTTVTGSAGTAPTTPKPAPAGSCADKNDLCNFWTGLGECTKNTLWMAANCAKACKKC